MRVIAVDYDGTLYMEDGTVNQEIKSYVNITYKSKGFMIVIHTARPESHRYEISAWLKSNDVLYHAIVCDKLPADVYVDDKSIHPDKIGETE